MTILSVSGDRGQFRLMRRERIADDICVFVSDTYAQVTATVIATSEGEVVFDTPLDDRGLLAADVILPVPHFVDGDFDTCLRSLLTLDANDDENIVRGHGDVILRGETEAKIASDLDDLERLSISIDSALRQPDVAGAIHQIDIESWGKDRMLLNGPVEQLHWQNVWALIDRRELLSQ